MKFPNQYKALSKNTFILDEYSILPIRFEDRLDIMKWRNEQMYHLRQDKPLTKERQDNYFTNVVSKLFDEEKPNQLLFSFLKNEELIGYGGLVHINWVDKNAEISFIMNTQLEKINFEGYWKYFLDLISDVAFNQLQFIKIFVYAFDIRPHLYIALENNDFFEDARLEKHCIYQNEPIDVVIYSKINL